MRVVAKHEGFYEGSRRRAGDIFEMHVEGKMPRWVEEVKNDVEAKAQALAAKRAEDKRMSDGAIAASGGKAAQAKVKASAQDLV